MSDTPRTDYRVDDVLALCRQLERENSLLRQYVTSQSHTRYEKLRCLSSLQFSDLLNRTDAGENFDEMVDNLPVKIGVDSGGAGDGQK